MRQKSIHRRVYSKTVDGEDLEFVEEEELSADELDGIFARSLFHLSA